MYLVYSGRAYLTHWNASWWGGCWQVDLQMTNDNSYTAGIKQQMLFAFDLAGGGFQRNLFAKCHIMCPLLWDVTKMLTRNRNTQNSITIKCKITFLRNKKNNENRFLYKTWSAPIFCTESSKKSNVGHLWIRTVLRMNEWLGHERRQHYTLWGIPTDFFYLKNKRWCAIVL